MRDVRLRMALSSDDVEAAAELTCASPAGDRSGSAQPVNWRESSQSVSPCRTRMSVPTGRRGATRESSAPAGHAAPAAARHSRRAVPLITERSRRGPYPVGDFSSASFHRRGETNSLIGAPCDAPSRWRCSSRRRRSARTSARTSTPDAQAGLPPASATRTPGSCARHARSLVTRARSRSTRRSPSSARSRRALGPHEGGAVGLAHA